MGGGALRCPICGNRDGLWVSCRVRLDGHGMPEVLIETHLTAEAIVECSRCEQRAPYPAYLPPWTVDPPRACACAEMFCAAPLPLRPIDRAEEASWAVRSAAVSWDTPPDDPRPSGEDPGGRSGS